MTTFKSKIELGKMYKDARTQIEGHANVACFHPHGCVEVQIEYLKDGKPEKILISEPRLVAAGGAELTGSFDYETDLVIGNEYEDIETGLRGHLSIVEFHEHQATRGILRMTTGKDKRKPSGLKYYSIDDFLLRDTSTRTVARRRDDKASPATAEVFVR